MRSSIDADAIRRRAEFQALAMELGGTSANTDALIDNHRSGEQLHREFAMQARADIDTAIDRLRRERAATP